MAATVSTFSDQLLPSATPQVVDGTLTALPLSIVHVDLCAEWQVGGHRHSVVCPDYPPLPPAGLGQSSLEVVLHIGARINPARKRSVGACVSRWTQDLDGPELQRSWRHLISAQVETVPRLSQEGPPLIYFDGGVNQGQRTPSMAANLQATLCRDWTTHSPLLLFSHCRGRNTLLLRSSLANAHGQHPTGSNIPVNKPTIPMPQAPRPFYLFTCADLRDAQSQKWTAETKGRSASSSIGGFAPCRDCFAPLDREAPANATRLSIVEDPCSWPVRRHSQSVLTSMTRLVRR